MSEIRVRPRYTIFLLPPRKVWENSSVSSGNTFWLMKVGNARSRT